MTFCLGFCIDLEAGSELEFFLDPNAEVDCGRINPANISAFYLKEMMAQGQQLPKESYRVLICYYSQTNSAHACTRLLLEYSQKWPNASQAMIKTDLDKKKPGFIYNVVESKYLDPDLFSVGSYNLQRNISRNVGNGQRSNVGELGMADSNDQEHYQYGHYETDSNHHVPLQNEYQDNISFEMGSEESMSVDRFDEDQSDLLGCSDGNPNMHKYQFHISRIRPGRAGNAPHNLPGEPEQELISDTFMFNTVFQSSFIRGDQEGSLWAVKLMTDSKTDPDSTTADLLGRLVASISTTNPNFTNSMRNRLVSGILNDDLENQFYYSYFRQLLKICRNGLPSRYSGNQEHDAITQQSNYSMRNSSGDQSVVVGGAGNIDGDMNRDELNETQRILNLIQDALLELFKSKPFLASSPLFLRFAAEGFEIKERMDESSHPRHSRSNKHSCQYSIKNNDKKTLRSSVLLSRLRTLNLPLQPDYLQWFTSKMKGNHFQLSEYSCVLLNCGRDLNFVARRYAPSPSNAMFTNNQNPITSGNCSNQGLTSKQAPINGFNESSDMSNHNDLDIVSIDPLMKVLENPEWSSPTITRSLGNLFKSFSLEN